TQIESGGVPVAGVTTDYDGDTRSVGTPDMGADEFAGIGADLSAPSIALNAVSDFCNTAGGTITALINDGSGVNNTAGSRPRLYFYKNAGSFNGTDYAEGTLTSGTVNSGTWTFVFNAALMGGLATSDVVSYFVIAQDVVVTPNVGANPGTGLVATSVSSITTYPTNPLTYSVGTSLGGTYTIPGAYPTLTAAIAAYQGNCLSSSVVFELASGYTSAGETFPLVINQHPDAGPTKTLTIRPATGSSPTITGALASGALIKLNGADWVTIDGSNSGGTDRSLTISNTATTAPVGIWISSLGDGAGATNSTIKNCVINTNAATTATAYGIAVSGATIASAGGDNDNITLQNNAIDSRNTGIYTNGNAAVSAGGMDNRVVTGNTFYSAGTVLPTYGVQVANALGASVDANTFNLSTTAGTAPVAISIEANVSNTTVTRNRVESLFSSNTGGYGGRGIAVGTGTTNANITIANNFIAGVNGSNWTGFGNSSSMGIALGMVGNSTTITTVTGGISIHHNTVNLEGNFQGTSTTVNKITAAIYVGSAASDLDIRNNLFSNSLVNTTAVAKAYAIYSAAANTAFTNIDNNNYYTGGSQAVLGFLGADVTTLGALQTAFGGNTNATNITPVFTSATNLHLNIGLNPALNATGTPIPTVPNDIDGDVRDALTPDAGADEFTPSAIDAIPPAVTLNAVTDLCNTSGSTVTATIADFGGVNDVAGTRPRLYYYKNAGTFNGTTYVEGTLTSGTVNSGTWTFVFNAALVGGLTAGDVVSYFVIAQDVAAVPNVGADPGAGLVASSVSSITTYPTTPAVYTVQSVLSGTYTIPGSYSSLGDAVSAYNTSCLGGNVVFELGAGYTSTGESFPITINDNADASATKTLTIRPATGATPVITGVVSPGALIKLNGADWVTIDGSNSGGTDRSLTLSNTTTSTSTT
ncbi:MAG: hypothetical protein IT229_12270, partial [Flavobacteriales bacterium]|nr:hypothetical protein [Flavobacteriales bacterium]